MITVIGKGALTSLLQGRDHDHCYRGGYTIINHCYRGGVHYHDHCYMGGVHYHHCCRTPL